MSSQQALNDLFAFLDQLELQEKLEQQSITTGGDTATEYSSPVQTEQSPISILNSAVILESPSQIRGPGVIANAYDNSVGSVATSDYSAPVLQDSEGRPEESPPETKENQISDTPLTMTTPPRRKAVQFNPITPLRTPHRRAPKFVFTPLKPSQSAAQLEPQVFSTIPLKGTVEVTVPTLDCGSSQLQPPPLGSVETSQDRPVEDSDEAVTPTSNIPSNSPFAVEDLLGNDDESIMSDSTSSPILHPSLPVARAKKRVIYSSDDDSDTGNSMVLAPRTISAAEEPGSDEIEFLGEKALQIDNNRGPTSGGEVPARNSRNRQTGRREVSKFIDDMARAVGKNDDEDSSDDGRDLDGFIVDDDYVEYEDDTAEEKSEGGDYVLSYSPTKPRLKRAPSKRLQVDLTETSDEDTPASPAAVLPPRPKPRARQTSAKSLETVQKIRSEKRAWNENKEKLAQAIMDDLDSLVFEGKLVKQWNVRAVWNNKLLTTAGRAHHKRVKMPEGGYGHEGRIELSQKVIDDEDKLKNTVAHEMCHLATWIISGEMKNPHGAIFKSWGRKVMKARRDIEVTTKHSYVITYKYEWECSTEGCGAIYRRHSKSIDIERQGCGKCRGKLKPLFKTRGAGTGTTAFQDFLKQNMKLAKAAMPKATHGEVMRALSERWKASGGAKSPAEITQTGEDPLAVQRLHAEYWQGLSLQMQGLSIN